jgi:PAS domain S-box-containing protein
MHDPSLPSSHPAKATGPEPPDLDSKAAALPLGDARFRALIESSWDAIALLTAEGIVQYASPATTRVLGYAPEELIGRCGLELIHPDDIPRIRTDFDEVLERPRRAMTTECRMQHRDGSWRWIECTGTNLLDDPLVQAVVCNYHDISERKQSEERLRLVTAGARCILWHAEVEIRGKSCLHWDLKVWDEVAARRFLPVHVPPGLDFLQAWYESILPEDKAAMDRYSEGEVRAGRSFRQQYRCRLADGRIRWLGEDVRIEVLTPGRWRAVGVITDITERQQAELALRESENRARAQLAELDHLYTTSPIGLGMVDTSLRYVRLNERLAEINGRPVAEHFGRTIREVVPGVAVQVEPLYRRVIETGEPVLNREVRGSTAAAPGVERDFLVSYYPLKSEEGSVHGVSLVVQDITERKQAELLLRHQAEALALADQRKDEFLAMLAHELRNPLAPIRNAVHLLRLRGTDARPLERAREVIERQVEQLARLVDDLLDVSRITQGRIELRPEPVELAGIVRAAVETSRPLIEAREHTLSVHLPPDPVHLHADPTRLEQIVTNLLQNAAKYTDPGGRIWLNAAVETGKDLTTERGRSGASGAGPRGRHGEPSREGAEVGERSELIRAASPSTPSHSPSVSPCLRGENRRVVLRVRDSGIGIPPELLPHVFDLFTQADRSLDRSQGGLGIGLTLVRRLVELHGGTVGAHSDGPGQGSEFVVRLPVRSDELRVTSDEESQRPPASTLVTRHSSLVTRAARVLVVDDNVDAAATLAELLELWGHEVRMVHEGPAAVEEAVRFGPKVALLDIGLPGMSGYEVARQIRERAELAGTLLIALTGYGQEEDREQALAAGFAYHLVKPVDLDRLRELLAAPGLANR